MDAFIRRMKHYVELSDDDFAPLRELRSDVREIEPGRTLVHYSDVVEQLFVIEAGWALRARHLPDGRRQVINLMMAGDYFDLMSLVGARSDHTVQAATPATIRIYDGDAFLRAVQGSHRLATAFWWLTVREESVLRQQVVRIGRMNARERIANFVLELSRRQDISTGSRDDFVTLPLPQAVLADALGLSIVHVSRSLTAMRDSGLVKTSRRGVTILDRPALTDLAGFEPDQPSPARLPMAAQ